MPEEQQVTKEPQQLTKEPQQVTTKNPKKVEAGKRLAVHNHRQREAKKAQREAQSEGVNQYYSISAGAVLAVGVIGGLGYYIYRTKKGEVNTIPNSPTPQNPPKPCPQNNKFEM